ncbi:MAG: site-2 protease family protein, partial [Myxococcaceae bacterium]
MLRFRLGSIPVLVHPGHLLFALALGLSAVSGSQPLAPAAVVVIWVALVFVSVLLHELGHALAFRAFGYRSSIQLLMFGGVTTPETDQPLPWGKDVVTTLAGPIFG